MIFSGYIKKRKLDYSSFYISERSKRERERERESIKMKRGEREKKNKENEKMEIKMKAHLFRQTSYSLFWYSTWKSCSNKLSNNISNCRLKTNSFFVSKWLTVQQPSVRQPPLTWVAGRRVGVGPAAIEEISHRVEGVHLPSQGQWFDLIFQVSWALTITTQPRAELRRPDFGIWQIRSWAMSWLQLQVGFSSI